METVGADNNGRKTVPVRDISTHGTGRLRIGASQFENIQYEISGKKRSRLYGNREIVMSADLRGVILNPQAIDSASQVKTMDIECQLVRSDGRPVPIDFSAFPVFHVMRPADGDAWSDVVLGK
jgi:hypothetical protein